MRRPHYISNVFCHNYSVDNDPIKDLYRSNNIFNKCSWSLFLKNITEMSPDGVVWFGHILPKMGYIRLGKKWASLANLQNPIWNTFCFTTFWSSILKKISAPWWQTPKTFFESVCPNLFWKGDLFQYFFALQTDIIFFVELLMLSVL